MEAAPWVLVAFLLHVAILLVVYLWAPSVGPLAESVQSVTIAVAENPYVQSGPRDVPPAPQPAPPQLPPDELDIIPPADLAAMASPPQTADPAVPPRTADADPHVPPGPPAGVGDAPGGGAFASRRGAGRSRALAAYGGDEASQAAVAEGLAWLAAHQRGDGAWDRRHFDDQCPDLDVCRETAVSWPGADADPAVTGLALLAFLGAGHAHEEGPYATTLTLGLHHLVSRQKPAGCFSLPDRMELYNDAIATLALAEAYALTGDAAFRRPVENGVRHLAETQQPCGGWDYTADVTTGRCDLSITAWVVLALKAAATAGVAVGDRTVAGVVHMLHEHTDAEGFVYYANKGTGTVFDPQAAALTYRYGPAMTAAGMLTRQLLGWRNDTLILQTQARLLLAEPPDLARLRGGDPTGLHSEYYWYYGTLAMFNQGGQAWPAWNRAVREALLASQDRSLGPTGAKRHSYGSWPAFGRGWGKWGRAGGRVYSTALGVLTLEVYYRYAPAYTDPGGLLRPATLRLGLQSRTGAARETWAATVADQTPAVAEPLLVELLSDPALRVRLRAALALAALGSPLGRPVLDMMRPAVAASERTAVDEALRIIDAMVFPQRYGLVVRIDESAAAVVFETGGANAYIGQVLAIVRDGRELARVRVTHRRPERQLAAGIIVQTTSPADTVAVGDDVLLPDQAVP